MFNEYFNRQYREMQNGIDTVVQSFIRYVDEMILGKESLKYFSKTSAFGFAHDG